MLNFRTVENRARNFDGNFPFNWEPVNENLNRLLEDSGIWDVVQPEMVGKKTNFLARSSDIRTNSERLASETLRG
jgi:hypothetical protein